MTDKDPFAEPDDTERTVIRPNPGGRRKTTPPTAVASSVSNETNRDERKIKVTTEDSSSRKSKDMLLVGKAGMNTLNNCASSLFALIGRVRNQAQHSDPDNLRKAVVSEVRRFENSSLEKNVDKQAIRVARYVICATIDDVILNTPWGGNSAWGMQSMVGTFHKETVGGDRFYDLLNKLEEDPKKNIELLEFIYMCLSLGFEGRLRIENGGKEKHTQIRQQLSIVIRRQRGDVSSDLSPNFEGVDNPFVATSIWKPFWLVAGIVLTVLSLIFLTLIFILSGKSDQFSDEISFGKSYGAPTLLRKAIPPPPPPVMINDDQLEVITSLLKKDIFENKITILSDTSTIILRIAGNGMFASGSDKLEPGSLATLTRVGFALKESRGPLLVVGHSDNVAIKSARFSSNTQLSLARAEQVINYLKLLISPNRRTSAEGHADSDPIASNVTKEGRAENRRIEIILLRTN